MEYTLRDGRILRIVPAQKEDASALLAYMRLISGESDNLTFGPEDDLLTVEAEEAYLEGMAGLPTSVMLLGWVDGEIVVSGVITGDRRRRTGHNAELGISVRKPYWRQGIGKRMMLALIDFARETGVIRTIHLTVRAENTAGIALYERLGFTHVGVHKAYFNVRGVDSDAVIMDLALET